MSENNKELFNVSSTFRKYVNLRTDFDPQGVQKVILKIQILNLSLENFQEN